MIHKVRGKSGILDLGILQVSCQLMNDGTNHLQMPQFFCTCIVVKMKPQTLFSRISMEKFLQ